MLESRRWQVLQRLQQHRLTRLSRPDLALVEDLVLPVSVADGPALYCLRTDLPALEAATGEAPALSIPPISQLLAPLDPLIYDRALTARLWDFKLHLGGLYARGETRAGVLCVGPC